MSKQHYHIVIGYYGCRPTEDLGTFATEKEAKRFADRWECEQGDYGGEYADAVPCTLPLRHADDHEHPQVVASYQVG